MKLPVSVPKAAALVRRADFPYRAPSVPAGVEPVPTEPRSGAHYDTEWARRVPARWVRAVILESVIRPTARAVADPDRRGLDRLAGLAPKTRVDGGTDADADDAPPVIFAANHHSHVDSGVILSSLPEPWRHRVFVGAAADYFFRNRATGALSALALNAIPIERTRVTRRSAAQAAQLLDEGWSMLIFPEGGRSPDGWGQPFRGGAAYLAIRGQVPVVPVHLLGTGKILPKGSKRVRPGRTVVTFGQPVWPAGGEDTRRFGARLEREVAALADEATTDWYSARRRAHAGRTPSLAGPDVGAWRRRWALDTQPRRSHRRRRRRSWPDLS